MLKHQILNHSYEHHPVEQTVDVCPMLNTDVYVTNGTKHVNEIARVLHYSIYHHLPSRQLKMNIER